MAAEQAHIKSEAYIKPEPEGDSPSVPLDEDDLYEDAGDLEFFDQNAGNGSVGQAYLARVPKELWEAWSSLPDDAEIEVGKMRQWDVPRPDGSIEVRCPMRPDTPTSMLTSTTASFPNAAGQERCRSPGTSQRVRSGYGYRQCEGYFHVHRGRFARLQSQVEGENRRCKQWYPCAPLAPEIRARREARSQAI